jgi:hypothetical protein
VRERRQIFLDGVVEADTALLTSCIAAVEVIALVIEAMRNSASIVSGRPVEASATPNAP